MDGITLLRMIRDLDLKEGIEIVDSYGNKYIYEKDGFDDNTLTLYKYDSVTRTFEVPDYSMFTDKDNEFEIEIKEKEIDIQSMEGVNGFKLIEAPYMAKCLNEGNNDTFTDLLKQSELELMNKIEELIKATKQLDKEIKEIKNGTN